MRWQLSRLDYGELCRFIGVQALLDSVESKAALGSRQTTIGVQVVKGTLCFQPEWLDGSPTGVFVAQALIENRDGLRARHGSLQVRQQGSICLGLGRNKRITPGNGFLQEHQNLPGLTIQIAKLVGSQPVTVPGQGVIDARQVMTRNGLQTLQDT